MRGEGMDNNLRKVLYELIGLLKHWEENFSNTEAVDINKVMYSFNTLLVSTGVTEFPLNIPDFIKMLKNKTLVEIGFTEEEASKQLVNEKVIVNNRLSSKFANWYEEIESLREVEQKAMLEFLLACRQHRGKEDETDYCNYYRTGRIVANKDNMIMSNMEFHQKLIQKRLPSDLIKIIKSWRRNVDIVAGTIIVCPVCGRRVDFQFGHEGCCGDVCNYYIAKNKLSFNKLEIKEEEQYSEFTEGIYRFILLPGIGENIIFENLRKFEEAEVELYPNMDEYDIEFKVEDMSVLIDVKDVQEPSELVELLKRNNSIGKLIPNDEDYKYLVIPEHRKNIFFEQCHVDYKKELIRLLQNEDLQIKVLYEKELYKEIEKLINDEF